MNKLKMYCPQNWKSYFQWTVVGSKFIENILFLERALKKFSQLDIFGNILLLSRSFYHFSLRNVKKVPNLAESFFSDKIENTYVNK